MNKKAVPGWKGDQWLSLLHTSDLFLSEVQPKWVTSWIIQMLNDINSQLEESGSGSHIKPIMGEDYYD